MWFVFILSLGFILPAIAAKSFRSKTIYFLNAFIMTWLAIESSKPFIEQIYFKDNNNISALRTISLLILSLLSAIYLIYGLIKLIKRRGDFKKLFSKNHNFNIKNHFSGELNSEEKFAIIAALPSIVISFAIIIIYVLQVQ